MPTYAQGFLDGISWALLKQAMNQRRIIPLLKPDEKIVCSYATVTVDKYDNWSWWRNNREPYIVRHEVLLLPAHVEQGKDVQ